MQRSILDITGLYLGPMSKNIVDSIIDYVKKYEQYIGLIASRRQVDCTGGYSNGWTTKDFTQYVRNKTDKIILCRDHGGIGQGSRVDDGINSLLEDAKYMDVIHIDPWKSLKFHDALQYTIKMIRECLQVNKNCVFEVGTEESIYPMNPHILNFFLEQLAEQAPDIFKNIIYAVIQSGTSLKEGNNVGVYERERLLDMINICGTYGILPKEHNGDYLTSSLIKTKLSLGLSAINIAPELANIETKHIINSMSESELDKWYDLTINDGQWQKWFSFDFMPDNNKLKVLELCGHYVFSHKDFDFDLNLVYPEVKEDVHLFISNILNGKKT